MHGGVRAACGRAPLDPAGSAIAALVFGDAATSANRSKSACGPAVRRRDGRFRHERVRRGLAFIAEESAAVGAPHGPADLPIMLPAERAAHDPLGVQLGLHAPAEQILALARLPHWQSGNDREIVEPRSTRRQNETEKGGAHRARARLQPPRGRRRRGIRRAACGYRLEGVVSKRIDRRYLPGDRSVWIKTKCLSRGEFVVAGWSEPEGIETLSRFAPARLSRRRRASSLCRPGRNRHVAEDARRVARASRPARGQNLPACHLAAARDALRQSPRAVARPLGFDLFSSPRSPISPGPTTGCSVTPSLSASATTSPRARCGENGRPDC